MLWPKSPSFAHFPGKKIIYGEEATPQKENLYKTFNDCLQMLFDVLFGEVTLITSDDDLISRSKFKTQYDPSQTRPVFLLATPKKAEIQTHHVYGPLYRS